jgi:hypothetical protein
MQSENDFPDLSVVRLSMVADFSRWVKRVVRSLVKGSQNVGRRLMETLGMRYSVVERALALCPNYNALAQVIALQKNPFQ